MKNMKTKIIGYLLYLVILIWLLISFHIMADEYDIKKNKRLDDIEAEVHKQSLNDKKFIENAMYYKKQFEKLSEKMDNITSQLENLEIIE